MEIKELAARKAINTWILAFQEENNNWLGWEKYEETGNAEWESIKGENWNKPANLGNSYRRNSIRIFMFLAKDKVLKVFSGNYLKTPFVAKT